MKKNLSQFVSRYTIWTSHLLISIFTICLLTGFSQSIYGLVAQNDHIKTCCSITSECHSGTTDSEQSQKGLCSIEKLTFKLDNEKQSIQLDYSLLISSSGYFELHPPVYSIYSSDPIQPGRSLGPPLYILRYSINAPPVS